MLSIPSFCFTSLFALLLVQQKSKIAERDGIRLIIFTPGEQAFKELRVDDDDDNDDEDDEDDDDDEKDIPLRACFKVEKSRAKTKE
jgi:phosphopantothenoylcysteine synthetase/decarboxylase